MRPDNIRVKLISLLLMIVMGAFMLCACSASGLEASSEQVIPAASSTSAPASSVYGSPTAEGTNPAASSSETTVQPAQASAITAGTVASSAAPTTTVAAATTAAVSSSLADNSPAASPAGSPASGGDSTPVALESYQGDGNLEYKGAPNGGGNNMVQLVNKKDNDMEVRGSTQLNKIWGPNVAPLNRAYAQASCTDCQTFAVALQINLISTRATNISPRNEAVALNYKCTRCITAAVAIQYTFQVDDPHQVPPRLDKLLKDMEKEINSLKANKGVTVTEAANRIDAVIAQFNDLAANLNKQQQESEQSDDPGVTPLPESTPEPSVTPGPNTPGASVSPDATPTGTSLTNDPGTSPAPDNSTPSTAPVSSTGDPTAKTGPVTAPAATTVPASANAPNIAPTPTPSA